MADVINELGRHLNRQAVRYAVQRAIFCPDCERVLDMDDAVLITSSTGAGISCGACYDARIAGLGDERRAVWHELVKAGTVEVDDGRELRTA